ncbi:MAG TPA: C39 family peptidase [Candidatus Paceibacterota bacterium]|nr:C39 family peptidase [Candidatus Paceibacterota bacterium]
MNFPATRRVLLVAAILLTVVFAKNGFVSVAEAANTASSQNANQQIADLNQKISEYQTKLKQVSSDKKTLQNTLKTLSIQTDATKAKISLAEQNIQGVQSQMSQLAAEISNAQQEIDTNQQALAEEIRNIAKTDDQPLILKVLAAGDFSETWNDVNENLQMQDTLQAKTAALKGQEQSLVQSKRAVQEKQVVLASQQNALALQKEALDQTTGSKQELLKETGAQESKYQELLKNAQAQLKSFSAFTQGAGGSGLTGNETVCDAWGCYYNQRDSAWGNDPLNGTQYRLASDGCLVTSLAMVLTHYGYRNVTPITINSNPANFAAYYPAFLLKTVQVGGVTATRVNADIDSTLAGGDPVIVGLHAYGGTHFVVLVSGSNGNYVMRDPYISNGKDVSFSAHYSLGSIYEINKVVIN